MLSKKYRLNKKGDFDRVFATGRKVVSGWFVLYGLEQVSNKPSKLGVVVSKNVGGSVVRNRVRRIIRETFQLNIVNSELYKTLAAAEVVIVVRSRAALIKNPELRKSLEDSLKRLDKCLEDMAEKTRLRQTKIQQPPELKKIETR